LLLIIEEETGWCVLTGTQPVPLDNLFTKNLQGDITEMAFAKPASAVLRHFR
jgi:hypothetical protein